MSLDFCCDIQMVWSEFGVKNMNEWIHPALSQRFRAAFPKGIVSLSTSQTHWNQWSYDQLRLTMLLGNAAQVGDGGVMVWGIFSWHTLGPLVPIEHRLNATAEYCCWPCLSLYDYSVPSSDGYFQQDNAPCHKAQIISDWFLEHDDKFTLLKWPPQSPDLNPKEHLWDVEREIRIMDVQPTNLQQLRDAIMSIWTKISEECFQHLVESMPRRIKAVLKAKGGPTRY